MNTTTVYRNLMKKIKEIQYAEFEKATEVKKEINNSTLDTFNKLRLLGNLDEALTNNLKLSERKESKPEVKTSNEPEPEVFTSHQLKLAALNKVSILYYGTSQMPNKEPVLKAYKTMHGLTLDMRHCLSHGGLFTNVCRMSKGAMPLTALSIELSLKGE